MSEKYTKNSLIPALFNLKNLDSEYAELEENLGDEDRVRGVYTIAIGENSQFLI